MRMERKIAEEELDERMEKLWRKEEADKKVC